MSRILARDPLRLESGDLIFCTREQSISSVGDLFRSSVPLFLFILLLSFMGVLVAEVTPSLGQRLEGTNETTAPTSYISTTTRTNTTTRMQLANWLAWNDYMSNIPASMAGCFEATYSSTAWQPSKCGTAPSIPLLPSRPSTVGNGVDEIAYSSGTLIGSSFGSFQSITGLTSESDSQYGTNEFSLQVNSQWPFTTSTTYTGGKSAEGWEQFVFLNDPSGEYGTQIYIQYWLINYYADYGTCPSKAPPGGGFNGEPWYEYKGSCVSNSPSYPSLTSETAPNLASLTLKGYANFGSGFDEVVICYSGGSCYTVALTDQVVNLYQHWQYSEFNVFGLGGGSEANFNYGTSITVVNSLEDQSGNVIVPTCMSGGYTGETNNLNLGSCSSYGDGQIVFDESNPAATVTTTVTSTASSTSYITQHETTTVTSYTSTSTSTSTIPTLTTVVLLPLTVTSTAQSTQYLTSTLTTNFTSYTSTETLTSTIPTTVALLPLTMTSTVQNTQYLTSILTTTVTSYAGTQTSTSTVVVPTTVVLVPSTVTSTVLSTQYLTSTLNTTVTSYTSTTTSTNTTVVYTTLTVSPGGAVVPVAAASSGSLAYLGFISLLAVTVGQAPTGSKGRKILRIRSLMGRRCVRT